MHEPVLLNEILEFAEGVSPKRILDATFGRGGHTRVLLNRFPEATVWALDRDHEAIEYAQKEFADEIRQGRLFLERINFHNWRERSKQSTSDFDFILVDLGVSSPQLDSGERGFSFYKDGPLDMRMDQSADLDAATIVNTWSEGELAELFKEYGEIRRPGPVVRAIVERRRKQPFERTRELAGLIEGIEGWRRKGHHPATTYFLALRMQVNDEMIGLESSLLDFCRALRKGGRLSVITFHSLEDRMVKYAMRSFTELGRPLNKKVIVPGRDEELRNPRSRSAKLRVFQAEG